MTTVNIHQAKSQLSRLIKAALEGEEIVITNRDVPVARLTPYSQKKVDVLKHAGSMQGKIQVLDEHWDAPLTPDEAALFEQGEL